MLNVANNLRTEQDTRHSWCMSSRRLASLVLGIVLLGPIGLPAATATPTPAPARASTLTPAQFEARLVALTNARRKKVGCVALKANTALRAAARLHTSRMVRTGSFSHQVPKEPALGPRITRAGYKKWKALAENIAWGQRVTPAAVFSMWMNSRPHKANIQNCRLHDVGYGVQYAGNNVWVTGDYGRR
jgi:uncharacterized protein YkwD